MFSNSQPPRLNGRDWLLPMGAEQTRCKSMIYTEKQTRRNRKAYPRGFLEQITSYIDGN